MMDKQLDDLLTEYNDVDALSDEDQRAIMVVKKGQETGSIERFIRRVFVWAVATRSSDVHIEGRGDRNTPDVHIHVRTPKGMVNMVYRGKEGRHFESKLFSITGTPQGGSTGMAVSTRFSMALPHAYATKHALFPREGMPYAVDVRVQFTRTFESFSFVCRLLDQQRTPGLDELNLPLALLGAIKTAAAEPSGLILASGPTGSGKTTLLNAVLGYLNDGQRSIITIENPVEIRLYGDGPIKQLQVQGEFTFKEALRAAVRMDPDVILIGEIRDEETMTIALQAAQTGHMVLSTVHANDAHETVSRLIDMGADPVRVVDTLKLVLAQRLINRYAGVPVERALTRDEVNWLEVNGMVGRSTIREVASSEKIGKVAAIEAILMNGPIKQTIRSGTTDAVQIYRLAREQDQYESLATAGVRAIETAGVKLKDCMGGLESNTDAQKHPNLRIRLSQQYGLTLGQIADAVDMKYKDRDAFDGMSLNAILQSMKEAECVEIS